MITCEVELIRVRSAVRLCLPADLAASLGTARLLPATVTINGEAVQTTLHKMDGTYMMAVNADLRRRLGVDAGDTVRVSAEASDAPRTVELPDDLAAALTEAGCRAAFEALSSFRQTELVKSVTGAKRASTRADRIAASVRQLTDVSSGPGRASRRV